MMTTQNLVTAVLVLTVVATAFPVIAGVDIPDPLPDPDTTPPDSSKPVKVYILSGQSNMVGMGNISPLGTPGTLETITKIEGKFPNLLDDAGAWTVRNDVMYRGVITAIGNGPLTPGVQGGTIGPELGFGHVMGYYHDEPVIVLKTSQGNRSLGWDCLPPGSERYVSGNYTYAGYGDSPNRWLTGSGPSPYVWYAGKQYDDYFLDESDMGPAGWAPATAYPGNCQVRHNGVVYISKAAHTSSGASEPGVGAQSSTYWNVYSVFNVTDILDNFAAEYPQYAAQGFEIAGFGWWQGHKDQYDASYTDRYELNLANFIKQVRSYYENRYPGHIKPNAPFVVATIGFHGEPYAPDSAYGKIHAAQMAISDPARHPEFAGNVASVETLGYWRTVDESPANQDYHYNRNAETFVLVGDAMGRAMAALLSQKTIGAIDFNKDANVDFADFSYLAAHFGDSNQVADIAPMPFGDGVVDYEDVAALADYWLRDVMVTAHWRLDEAEGNIAHEDVSDRNGILHGDPTWRNAGGKVGGALEFDGIDDYVSTDAVLDPAEGQFSVFAWVKGGAAGQAIISQTDGTGIGRSWLAVGPSGNLMTDLRTARRGSPALFSESLITDGDWHRVGFSWRGSYRLLYVDGELAATDPAAQPGLRGADGGLYFGAAKDLAPTSFFHGLLDDIRIYDEAVLP